MNLCKYDKEGICTNSLVIRLEHKYLKCGMSYNDLYISKVATDNLYQIKHKECCKFEPSSELEKLLIGKGRVFDKEKFLLLEDKFNYIITPLCELDEDGDKLGEED